MIDIITNFDAVQSLVGGELSQPLDGIIRYLSGQTPPSDSEIDAEVIRLQAEYDAQYNRKKATADAWRDEIAGEKQKLEDAKN